ncbi:MAG: hypothetical protein P4K98_08785 [Bryobacteraceae bacterium]|nr:hypothetical protein [Bryobacteraceae bacterium]
MNTGNARVDAISAMPITGPNTPLHWYSAKEFRSGRGRPNYLAVAMLSYFVYLYEAVEDCDETTSGRWMRKRFKEDKARLTYGLLADVFTCSKGQAADACKFLRDRGMVTLEFRTTKIDGVVTKNALYIDVVPEAIEKVLFPIQKSV